MADKWVISAQKMHRFCISKCTAYQEFYWHKSFLLWFFWFSILKSQGIIILFLENPSEIFFKGGKAGGIFSIFGQNTKIFIYGQIWIKFGMYVLIIIKNDHWSLNYYNFKYLVHFWKNRNRQNFEILNNFIFNRISIKFGM